MAGDVRNSAGKVGPGIDVRGSGGYVVTPPSPHPDGGTYAWAKGRGPEDIPVAEAPDWLLALVLEERSGLPSPPPLQLEEPVGQRYVVAAIEAECVAVAASPEGTRNESLNRAAFALARFTLQGQADSRVLSDLLTSAAAQAGLPTWEARRTIASAFRARRTA